MFMNHMQETTKADEIPLTQVTEGDARLQDSQDINDDDPDDLNLTQIYHAPGSFVQGEIVQVNYKGLGLYLDARVVHVGTSKTDTSMLVQISEHDRHPNEMFTVQDRFDTTRVLPKNQRKHSRYSLRLSSRAKKTLNAEPLSAQSVAADLPRRSTLRSARTSNRKV